jgi:hypothetical protein
VRTAGGHPARGSVSGWTGHRGGPSATLCHLPLLSTTRAARSGRRRARRQLPAPSTARERKRCRQRRPLGVGAVLGWLLCIGGDGSLGRGRGHALVRNLWRDNKWGQRHKEVAMAGWGGVGVGVLHPSTGGARPSDHASGHVKVRQRGRARGAEGKGAGGARLIPTRRLMRTACRRRRCR